MNLKDSVILIPDETHSMAESVAARLLRDEVEKRTGVRLHISTTWPEQRAVIAVTTSASRTLAGKEIPRDLPELKPEGYQLWLDRERDGQPVVWIVGADGRGVLFGVGRLIRLLNWGPGEAILQDQLDIAASPAYPIRGHQLGYRARANSYDAWDAEIYEQYIRDLVLFGTNCIENIPFEDDQPSPVMPVPRDEMNVILSGICARYDLDYWVWTPVVFSLDDEEKRAAEIERHKSFYKACQRLDAVFAPGGDPGDNSPELLLPFLKDIGEILMEQHPKARVWLSLQGFKREEVDYVHLYIQEHNPDWLGGLVAGPSSPPIIETRTRLPQKYGLRSYPDITHTVRCQYPVAWWDPAYSLTLGRECPNPQPVYYAHIHNWFAPYTQGFISYSDGIHDDVNKCIWSARGWDPEADVREVLKEYARVFFRPDLADAAADGILALEKNWEGSLAENGAVEGTLALWQSLEARAPELKDNWRWQLCLLRSVYDAYTRRRLLYESSLENKANAALAEAPNVGADAAMDQAMAILNQAVSNPAAPELRRRIDELCEALFESIGLQTSVEKYHASGPERGAILDYVDYPLNNRWWLEDEFEKIRKMASENEKLARLETIRTWENPGPGSLYDDVGNVARSPHVVRGEGLNTDPLMRKNPNPGHWWRDSGYSRARLSWQVSMNWPIAVKYENLDPAARYIVRMTGYGDAYLRMNGVRVTPTLYGKEIGEIKEFPVPEDMVKDGKLIVTWDRPDERHLNWRQHSRITEIWMIKEK
jgi:hypothetical protein